MYTRRATSALTFFSCCLTPRGVVSSPESSSQLGVVAATAAATSEDDYIGLTKFACVETEAPRARKKEAEEYERDKHVFPSAIGLDEDETVVKDEEEGPEIVRLDSKQDEGDFFTEVDRAVALRRKELIKEGSLKPRAAKKPLEKEIVDYLEKEEVIDLDKIRALQDKNIVELVEVFFR